METRFTLTQGEGVLRDFAGRDWYCADVGLVESEEQDNLLGSATRSVLIGRQGAADVAGLLPTPEPTEPTGGITQPADEATGDAATTPGDPEEWELERVGRARVATDAGESTVPPLWVPGEPPLLLAAGYNGDLLALEAGDDLGTIRWRFRPGGTIYSPPAYDAARGRLYFGAGDRRVYALDVRGLFLWSFETGDNVATRPLLVALAPARTSRPDLVVVGSEDGTIYALDAESGAERWRVAAGGPVVSSPVLVGGQDRGVVAIGSDDGSVIGLDAATGAQRWRYAAGGATEAPLVLDAGTVYVASRDGTVAAFDPATCETTCSASWETKLGGLLRQAPAVGGGRAFVVDDDGYLVTLDAQTGRRLWSTPEAAYVGPPTIVGASLVLARRDGDVSWLDEAGVELKRWSGAEASGPVDARPKFELGPSAGGGALWLADDGAVVRRLGPASTPGEAAALRATLALRSTQSPFDGGLLVYTPAAYQGTAVVLNPDRGVYLVDPATGRGVRRATIPGDTIVWPTDPVVAGDTLLATVSTTLHAVDLPTGQVRWSFLAPVVGSALRPPSVVGDTVLWAVSQEAGGEGPASAAGPRGVLYAVSLADRTLRWQAPLGGYLAVGGALGHGDTAYTSTPPAAYDLQSGAPRWQAGSSALPGLALGGPALDEAGATVFVGALDPQTNVGKVVALRTADGSPRWQAELGSDALRGTERLWLDGDTVIVPAASGAVIGLDVGSGLERWRYRPDSARLGSVGVEAGRIWLVLENAQVIGLDARTGRVVARFRDLNTSLEGQGINQRPVVIGGRLLAAVGRMLLGFPLP